MYLTRLGDGKILKKKLQHFSHLGKFTKQL